MSSEKHLEVQTLKERNEPVKNSSEMLLALGIDVSLFQVSLSDRLTNIEIEGCGALGRGITAAPKNQ